MYIYKKDADQLSRRVVRDLIRELTKKNKILKAFLKEDDWSFVIKAHALIEAAVTQLVIANVGAESLKDFLQRLPLGGQFGKLKLCEQMGLLSGPQRKFVRWLSEFRNPLVHNVEKISFTFAEHVKGLSKEQLAQLLDAVVWFSPENKKTQEVWRRVARDESKHAVWMGLYLVVNECTVQSHHADALRTIRTTSERTMRTLSVDSIGEGSYQSDSLTAVNKILSEYAAGGDPAAVTTLSVKQNDRRGARGDQKITTNPEQISDGVKPEVRT